MAKKKKKNSLSYNRRLWKSPACKIHEGCSSQLYLQNLKSTHKQWSVSMNLINKFFMKTWNDPFIIFHGKKLFGYWYKPYVTKVTKGIFLFPSHSLIAPPISNDSFPTSNRMRKSWDPSLFQVSRFLFSVWVELVV